MQIIPEMDTAPPKRTALSSAIMVKIIQLLYKKSCHVICPCDLLMDVFVAEIKRDNADFFEMLFHIEFKTTLPDVVNREKRNVAHIAALFGAEKCLDLFIVKFKFQLSQKDQYGSTI
jgi:hypothetical protein